LEDQKKLFQEFSGSKPNSNSKESPKNVSILALLSENIDGYQLKDPNESFEESRWKNYQEHFDLKEGNAKKRSDDG